LLLVNALDGGNALFRQLQSASVDLLQLRLIRPLTEQMEDALYPSSSALLSVDALLKAGRLSVEFYRLLIILLRDGEQITFQLDLTIAQSLYVLFEFLQVAFAQTKLMLQGMEFLALAYFGALLEKNAQAFNQRRFTRIGFAIESQSENFPFCILA
jgi:hypothetical protein